MNFPSKTINHESQSESDIVGVLGRCCTFVYLLVLCVFARRFPLLLCMWQMMMMFSYFACVLSIFMCFLELPHICSSQSP